MFRSIQKKDPGSPVRLGILKGGQLGRMLIQACMNYDMQSWVMDNDENAPCSHFCSRFIIGDVRSYNDVLQFGRKVDVLTLEVEDINTEALDVLEKEGLPIYPQPAIIRLIQDKGLQKEFYRKHGFPTSDFLLLEKGANLGDHLSFFPAVLKSRRSGYDGKGVSMINSRHDVATPVDTPSVLERKVAFVKEISILAARNASGQCAVYPAAELVSDPQKHLLDLLIAPAEISLSCQSKAQKIAVELIEKLGLVGLLAVEMFVTADDDVLINEISPRPHNSGHYTIEASQTSQFDQHLRAILDLPLGSTEPVSPAVMVNLLGESGHTGTPVYFGIEKVLAMPGVYVHLYGKERTAPFRKMGHITILDKDPSKAKEKALWVKKNIAVRAQ